MQQSCEAGCELSKSAVQLANIFPLGIQQFNLGTGIMGRWWVVGGGRHKHCSYNLELKGRITQVITFVLVVTVRITS